MEIKYKPSFFGGLLTENDFENTSTIRRTDNHMTPKHVNGNFENTPAIKPNRRRIKPNTFKRAKKRKNPFQYSKSWKQM